MRMIQRLEIRNPGPEAAEAISALALRSKAHWGYGEAFLEACRGELTYSAEQCASRDMVAAFAVGQLAGFARVLGDAPDGELAALFMDPPWMGRGVGKALLGWSLGEARRRGMARLHLDADPGAEPFYAHHGARTVGRVASGSIPGRDLPHMEFLL